MNYSVARNCPRCGERGYECFRTHDLCLGCNYSSVTEFCVNQFKKQTSKAWQEIQREVNQQMKLLQAIL